MYEAHGQKYTQEAKDKIGLSFMFERQNILSVKKVQLMRLFL